MRKRSGRPPRFAAVPNRTIDDSVRLTLPALALLTILLRHRDGWEITLAEIGEKWGYGEDAMASAMGFLQVARYVVKVRIQQRAGNRWRTEITVYDTPASDEEVATLLSEVWAEEPDALRVEVIPPTKKALERAGKRREKLGAPRPRENPDSGASSTNTANPQVTPDSGVSRDPGDPGVSKKTVIKKTMKEDDDTCSRPSMPAGSGAHEPRADGRTDGGSSAQGPGSVEPVTVTPGVELLLAIAHERPEYLITGKTLQHQGGTVSGMLASGWTPQQVRQVIIGQPLPDPIRTSVGAVVAGRLRRALAPGIAPSAAAAIPAQAPAPDAGVTGDWTSVPPTADRSVAEAKTYRSTREECAACGDWAVAGETLCAVCLGWPECAAGCGISGVSRRRVDPAGPSTCSACRAEAATPTKAPTDDELRDLLAQAASAARAAQDAEPPF